MDFKVMGIRVPHQTSTLRATVLRWDERGGEEVDTTIKRGWTMRRTQVKRDELLSILRNNLKKHIADYQEACEGYREQAVLMLDKAATMLVKQKGKFVEASDGDLPTIEGPSLHLKVPQSHEKAYYQAIRMLELEQREVLELEADEFSCFVMDDWEWKQEFTRTTATYSKFAK